MLVFDERWVLVELARTSLISFENDRSASTRKLCGSVVRSKFASELVREFHGPSPGSPMLSMRVNRSHNVSLDSNMTISVLWETCLCLWSWSRAKCALWTDLKILVCLSYLQSGSHHDCSLISAIIWKYRLDNRVVEEASRRNSGRVLESFVLVFQICSHISALLPITVRARIFWGLDRGFLDAKRIVRHLRVHTGFLSRQKWGVYEVRSHRMTTTLRSEFLAQLNDITASHSQFSSIVCMSLYLICILRV